MVIWLARWLVGRLYQLLATMWSPCNWWGYSTTYQRPIASLDAFSANTASTAATVNIKRLELAASVKVLEIFSPWWFKELHTLLKPSTFPHR